MLRLKILIKNTLISKNLQLDEQGILFLGVFLFLDTSVQLPSFRLIKSAQQSVLKKLIKYSYFKI